MADVKMLHNHVFDEIKDGKLNLYFPHNLDTKQDPSIIKNMFWLKDSGFRHNIVSKKRTDIIYPSGFNIASCFEERESYDYVSSLNKISGVKMTANDFFIFMFSKFLKSSKLCKKSFSYMHDFSEKDYTKLKSKLKYFKRMNRLFENESDELVFTKDLKPSIELEDHIKGKFLRGDLDKKILLLDIINQKKHEEPKIDSQLRRIYLPTLKFKGKKDVLFEDIINILNDFFEYKNHKIYYNIMVGMLLSNDLQKKEFEIDLFNKESLLKSGGLFITETYSKLIDIDIIVSTKDYFNSNALAYHKSKSLWYYNPSILYKSLVNHCEVIDKILNNSDYDLHNDDNVRVFLLGMMEDLQLGMKSLGMFLVNEIDSTIKNI